MFFMGESGLSDVEKKELVPFLKYGEDALTAMEAVDRVKPQNLRETVEVSAFFFHFSFFSFFLSFVFSLLC